MHSSCSHFGGSWGLCHGHVVQLAPGVKGGLCQAGVAPCGEEPKSGLGPYRPHVAGIGAGWLWMSSKSLLRCWALLGGAATSPPQFTSGCHPEPSMAKPDQCSFRPGLSFSSVEFSLTLGTRRISQRQRRRCTGAGGPPPTSGEAPAAVGAWKPAG